MKNKFSLSYIFSLSALIFLAGNICFAQTGWIWQNPSPAGMKIGKSYYVNNNLIYANGPYSLLKSTNGGANWSGINLFPADADSSQSFAYAMTVFDEDNIYILAARYNYPAYNYSPFLMKTSNAGASWESVSIPYTWVNSLKEMKFINKNTGFCWNDSFMPMFKTTNAGVNWQKLSIEGNDTLDNIYFINESTGFVSSANYVTGNTSANYYRTTNGGENWTKFSVADFYPLFSVSFINVNTGWALVGDSIYKTSNGGINFTPFAARPGMNREIGFFNENSGWANIDNDVYTTTNGGLNWNFSLSTNIGDDVHPEFNFRPDGTCIITSSMGRVYKTTNSGAAWNQYFRFTGNYSDFNDINFLNSSTGIAAGYKKILRTSDGGESWSNADSLYNYQHIKFLNQNNAVLNADNYLGRSTDGGLTWTYTFFAGYSFNEIFYFNNTIYTIGWFNGSAPKLFKSINSGQSWSSVNLPSNLAGINFFLNENTGWCGNQKTTNGRLNWFANGSNLNFIKKFYFADANTGWCLSDSALLKSTNGGASWIRKFTYGFNSILFSFNFVNQNTGYAYGSGTGVIYKTTDAGETWVRNDNLKAYGLYAGSFINANTGWLAGDNGIIIKTTTGGNVNIQQVSASIPDKFYLEQNYPNPFNPSTNIEFSLPQKTFVKLKVFDLLGREIANLVNENLSAGKYNYDFNASSLPSGIYFYKLETENFSETKKMVLVK